MNSKIILAIIIVCAICCCALGGVIAANIVIGNQIMVYPDPYISQLPDSARNIQEKSVDLFPDWAYYLKAEIEADEFLIYVQTISLNPYTPSNTTEEEALWLNWRGGPLAPVWWDPSTEIAGMYWHQNNDAWVLAKYENGNLYLMRFSH